MRSYEDLDARNGMNRRSENQLMGLLDPPKYAYGNPSSKASSMTTLQLQMPANQPFFSSKTSENITIRH